MSFDISKGITTNFEKKKKIYESMRNFLFSYSCIVVPWSSDFTVDILNLSMTVVSIVAANSESTSSLKLTHSTLSMTSISTLTPESPETHPLPVSHSFSGSTIVKNAVEHIIDLLKSR